MFWKIEIKDKPGIFDAVGAGIKKESLSLGIKEVRDVKFWQIYIIEAELPEEQIRRLCEELLVDKISQDYSIFKLDSPPINEALKKPNQFVIEVAYNPGVMDPVEESALKGIRDLGIEGVSSVKTAKKYIIEGNLTRAQLNKLSEKLLYNKLIQHIVGSQGHKVTRSQVTGELSYQFNLIAIDLLAASNRELLKISKDGQLFLNLAEMQTIKKYFKKLGRNPTDCELETIAQTWSEHCWHKTFRGKIEYREITRSQGRKVTSKRKIINNLLKSTIMKVTEELNKPWCISVFKDNSGIIRFDDKYNICFKVETHNHPSALEPFGGANTGIGGVIRDPLGSGLGAKPIFNTDVFCFGSPDYPFSKVPCGLLHPKRVMKGVVSGVRDYGNKMGIPTVNGAILFHERFVGNPLVYCGTAGIMPKEKSFKEPKKGDLIVVVGGRTGRDGIHGATFSSGELTDESERVSGGAVQIGNPIQEKKMLDAILEARDKNLYNAITDCGAGGLSSAVGEMGEDLGAEVYLDKAPLKYSGLSYMEIWISESQERMVLSVPKENIEELTDVFEKENVELAVIGEFTDTKRLKLYYKNNLVCDLEMEFLHKGLPLVLKKAVYIHPKIEEPKIPCPGDLTANLLRLLSQYDIASKEWVIRQYDHEVQGGSVLKPLVGVDNDGPSDASVIRPILDSQKAVIVSCGINFRFGLIDPYWMSASCIDEALRNIIAVGGSLKEVALLDNFCWGNPDRPDTLGGLVRAAYGCYDIAKAFGAPFISGKDSLNNEFRLGKESIAIPGTLLISAISVMDDASKTISMYAKQAGDLLYVVGDTFDELGGSHYFETLGFIGDNVPKVNVRRAKELMEKLSRAINRGLVKAAHDCSEGGLAVALAEMAFSGDLGMEVFLSEVPYRVACHLSPVTRKKINDWRLATGDWRHESRRNDFILFSESNSRFIVEVEKDKQKEFEKTMQGVSFGLLGCVSKNKDFRVYGLDNNLCIEADIRDLKECWQKPLRW